MPPELWDVLDRFPATRTWKARRRGPEADLAGLRDRALLLVGFVPALRRSDLVALGVDRVAEHPNGLVLSIPRSTTNQTAERAELVVFPLGPGGRRVRRRAVGDGVTATVVQPHYVRSDRPVRMA